MSKDGGPAFPFPGEPGIHAGNTGMSMRDYFAGQVAEGDAAAETPWNVTATDEILLERAKFYYRIADAMLKARQS